jgi:hypothetical protein
VRWSGCFFLERLSQVNLGGVLMGLAVIGMIAWS